jgi:7,8-dihydroneopterin aldolase/epimerase/oxygenase
MIKISLDKLKMFAFHGIHPEERTAGAAFEIQMDVLFEPDGYIREISQTINYVDLYEMIRDRMKEPSGLLETVCMDISRQVKERYPVVKEINITISKLNPPLANFRGELSVTLTNTF